MDKIFDDEAEKYVVLLERYLNDGVELQEVILQAKRLDLVEKVGDRAFLHSLREKVFCFGKSEYDVLMELDARVKKSEGWSTIDIDEEVFLAQARRMSAVRAPPFGYERSVLFKPPYPTQEMMNRTDNEDV